MVKTKCDFCGAEIKVKPSKMKKFKRHFCNKDCFNKWSKYNTPKGKDSPHYKEKAKLTCEYCGKEFEKYHAWAKRTKMHFCSNKCLHNWKREHPIKGKDSSRWNSELISCDFCGKEFYLPKHRLVSKNHFCSTDCYFSWIRANPKIGKDNKDWNRKKTRCDLCGEVMYCTPSRLKLYNHQFCSKECYDLWQKQYAPRGKDNKFWKRVKLSCSCCGKIIERANYRDKTYNDQFCSKECFVKWKKETSIGKNNPHWNGGKFPYYGTSWAKNRRITLENARFKSEISNIPAKTVHHIMPLKSFIEHAFDLFLYHIPDISFESFKILPYDLLIPDIFFDEANDISNLIVLTSSEHPRYEGEPLSFFEEIRNAC